MKQRFYLFVLLCIFLLVILIVAAASSSGSSSKAAAGLATCTINPEKGVLQIKISNQDTETSIIKTAGDLPFSFYFNKGDTISLDVTVQNGYYWNSWEINQAPWFDNHNPISFKATNDVTLTPKCLRLEG